jgi:ribose-phosphate pyrophosphokinase
MRLIGEVEGKDIVLVDDMPDTAGTLTKACDIMVERGARSVRAMVSHPILSGAAYEKIENSKITELITTDSIPLKKESAKIKVLSCASLMADAIKMIEDNASLSAKFIL